VLFRSGLFSCYHTGCLNNGSCFQIMSANGQTEYKCQCKQEFTGLLCDTILDKCYSNPCLNNGTCVSTPFEEAKCTCQAGYTGSKCEIFQNQCLVNSPCLNGGTCVPQAANTDFFYCECPVTFEGKLCERETITTCVGQPEGKLYPHPTNKSVFLLCGRNGAFNIQACPGGLVYNLHLERCDYNSDEPDLNDPCKQTPCKNGAKCSNVDDGFTCDCTVGFTGDLCEANIDECESADCGEGPSCIDLINGYVCICPNNFYGSDCKTNKIAIPCVEGFYVNASRFMYPFDPSVIVECNENGKLLLNKCAASLYWDPFSGACTFEPVNLKKPLECLKMKCLNRGKCALDRNKQAFCVCESGFEGEFCEININDCASNPCSNNGTCIDGINRYHCVCHDKYIDRSCYDVAAPNPCKSVVADSQNQTDKTVRHAHPFTMEKYLVCNLEGYAQVLSCPEGLFWSQLEQTCLAIDSRETYDVYSDLCKNKDSKVKFVYQYSKLKYVHCGDRSLFSVETCPKETPYFCPKLMKCVDKYESTCEI